MPRKYKTRIDIYFERDGTITAEIFKWDAGYKNKRFLKTNGQWSEIEPEGCKLKPEYFHKIGLTIPTVYPSHFKIIDTHWIWLYTKWFFINLKRRLKRAGNRKTQNARK